MGKIVMSAFITLDGVVQDPAGNEGFARGGWVGPLVARAEVAQVTLDQALSAEALLFGRRSYEMLAGLWPNRTGPLADRLNSLPKYVLSSNLAEAGWSNSAVLRGDVVEETRALRQTLSGELNLIASFQLGRTLLEHGLVDELRLMVLPVVLGAGERLFGETSGAKPLRLLGHRSIGDGVAYLTYAVADEAG